MEQRTRKDWEDLFKSYDRNCDGSVSRCEAMRLMRYCGFNPTKEDMEEMTKKEQDTVEFEEFYEFAMKQNDPFGELRDAFNVFDKNGDGYIDVNELRQILHDGDTRTDEEIKCLMKEVDENGDGKLQYEEFIKIWCN